MADLVKVWTRAEVLDLPDDGNRYELVDGSLLVSPSPRLIHQLGVAAFFRRLDPYVRAHRLGELASSPADLDLGSDQLVQPDLFVAGTAASRPREWKDVGIPLLAVEVFSPSTARNDRVIKRRRYQRSGVPAYWIVDLDARLVEVWTPGDGAPVIADDVLLWEPDGRAPALEIDLPACFREVWGE